MTEEIKEILDLLNFNKDTILNRTCRVEDFMSREQIIKLLDYITNLQQENEKLKYNARGQVNDYFKDKYVDEVLKNAELKEENKTLKEKINTLKSNFEVNIDDCENYKKWYRDYKSRCEKAIKFITSTYFYGMRSGKTLLQKYLYKLIDILNGVDENEG